MAERHRTRNFVLRPPRARAELVAVARAHGWSGAGERQAGDGKPYLAILDTGFPGVTVWYTELEDPYVCVVAVDSQLGPEAVGTPATLVQGMLVPWTLGELLAAASREDGERREALRTAAVGAPGTVSDGLLELFTAVATGDGDPELRHTAVWALATTEWPEAVGVLERVARDDEHPEVRGFAAKGVSVLGRVAGMDRPVAVAVDDLFDAGVAPGLWRVAAGELRAGM